MQTGDSRVIGLVAERAALAYAIALMTDIMYGDPGTAILRLLPRDILWLPIITGGLLLLGPLLDSWGRGLLRTAIASAVTLALGVGALLARISTPAYTSWTLLAVRTGVLLAITIVVVRYGSRRGIIGLALAGTVLSGVLLAGWLADSGLAPVRWIGVEVWALVVFGILSVAGLAADRLAGSSGPD